MKKENLPEVLDLRDEELMTVEGGLVTTISFLVGCYTIGYLIGKAYSHYRHSRKRRSRRYRKHRSIGSSPLYGSAH